MERKTNFNQPPDDRIKVTSQYLNNFFDEEPAVFFWSLIKTGKDENLYFSEAVEKVTGYISSELRMFPGKVNTIIFEEDKHRIKRSYSEFSEDPFRKRISFIYRLVTKDKKLKWVEEKIKVERGATGEIKEIRGMVSDISRFKEDESLLARKIADLQQLNNSKDKFISMLSHDLRAPFTSILGFSEILLNEPDLTKAERLEYLQYINDSSQHQLHLINYLLDWTRLQTGRIKVEPQRLNAQVMIYNCVSSLTGNAIRKNLEIKVNVKNNLFIQADERLFTQVVTNLLNNAIKFSYDGKTIEINADYFNEEMAEFTVKDEGTGINDKNKDKLFKIENMFSVEGTKGEKGTGLGLPLVKEIVEKHDGEIWFYSESGIGSEFHFTVPYSHNTILLVESEHDQLQKYESLIKDEFANFRMIGVKNGYEALNKISEQTPSLVITDYEMPLMNGIQLIQYIRKEDKSFKIPIIATVKELTDNFMQEYRELGIDTVLQKPVDEIMLIEKLQVILDY